MKTPIKYFLGLSVIASLAFFSLSSFKTLDKTPPAKSLEETEYLSTSEVLASMSNLGATITTPSPLWSPPASFTGYHSVLHYDILGQLHTVFVWDSPLNEDFLTLLFLHKSA